MKFKEALNEGKRANLKSLKVKSSYIDKEIKPSDFISNPSKYIEGDANSSEMKKLISNVKSWAAKEIIAHADTEIIPMW